MTQIFLLANPAAQSFPDPGNWNPFGNTIECIGSGGRGANVSSVGLANGGNGGGGGAYAVAHNVAVAFPVSYVSAPGGSIGLQNDQWTVFGSSKLGSVEGIGAGDPCYCYANGGANPTGPSPGRVEVPVATAMFPTGFAGGNGGSTFYSSGAGGGGAGGPHGAGTAGTNATGAAAPGNGGAGDNNTVPGGTGSAAAGGSGTQWDSSHGIGGGGAGAGSNAVHGGAGGNYGGGSGGAFLMNNGVAGVPGDGIIVLTYVPRLPAGTTRIFLYPYWPTAGYNTTYTRQFPNPGNWNPGNNKVECLGSGGIGVQGFSGDVQGNAGSGGGGGGYSFDVNLSPTFPVGFNIVQGVTSPDDDNDSSTWWHGSTWTAGNVIGGYGYPATGFVGSGAGNSSPGAGGGTRSGQGSGNSTNYPTANGAVGGGGGGGGNIASVVTGGGSGGGAAGPHGAGLAGVNGGAGVANQPGGAGDAGNSPGVSGGSTSGTQWDSLHGVGSGGSSGAAGGAAYAGGNFGGAGGGGFSMGSGTPGGPASPGLIVITYTPKAQAPQAQVQILA